MDRCQAELSPLRSFVLPGGSPPQRRPPRRPHRLPPRRAPRRRARARAEVDPEAVRYLNRLERRVLRLGPLGEPPARRAGGALGAEPRGERHRGDIEHRGGWRGRDAGGIGLRRNGYDGHRLPPLAHARGSIAFPRDVEPSQRPPPPHRIRPDGTARVSKRWKGASAGTPSPYPSPNRRRAFAVVVAASSSNASPRSSATRRARVRHVRGLALLAAERDRGEVRAVGLDEDAIRRRPGGHLLHGRGVLERDDAREREVEAEVERALGERAVLARSSG